MKRNFLGAALTVAGGVCAALAPGHFSHEMPEATNQSPTNPDYAEMAAAFRNPFGKVQTGVYWYWLSGNISCEGIRKDLEAMKRAGIDRAYIGDVGAGGNPPGSVRTFDENWWKALGTAFEAASELGIELGLFNSPGWSQSGGPWITHDKAMRRLVSSRTDVFADAARKAIRLPRPAFEGGKTNEYRDVAVVAYPYVPRTSFEKTAQDDRRFRMPAKGPLVELFEFRSPARIQSATLAPGGGRLAAHVTVEAERDGAFVKVGEFDFSRVNPELNVGFLPLAPAVGTFAPVTSRRFRLMVASTGGDGKAWFRSLALEGDAKVASFSEKTLAKMFETPLPMWKEYQWPRQADEADGSALDPARALVLTDRLCADGTLDWTPPDCRARTVYRFGMTPTRTTNAAAVPEATGYEVDKLNATHVAEHVEAYLGKILDRIPEKHRKAATTAVLDSYEVGGQNFTDDFAARFKASFGYDPTPWLATYAGDAVGSRTDSDRFLWDVRRFVADEVAYSYVGGLRKASGKRGLRTWLECYGHWGFPGEFLQYGGQSDGIGGEFWSEGSLGDIENRAASSCGHIYGKRLVWSESNTCGGNPFGRGPMDLKSRTDRFFADGINASILHLYVHQHDERAPGNIAWFGNEFNRKNTWFAHFDLFSGYLKRTNYLLQQGLNVADIAYFIGEDAPKMTGVTDPGVPRGRQFDYVNGEVLRETMGVDGKGRLVLPHGTAYELLVLPKLKTMRPELLEKIDRLVREGAFVLGPKPERSPSLAGQPQADTRVRELADRLWGEVDGDRVKYSCRGKGVIAWGLSVEEALRMRRSADDLLHDGTHHLIHAHRTLPNAEIYFVAVFGGQPAPSAEVSFRVAGRIPELWDAATGEMREADAWRFENGRTVVNLSLAPHGSVFVVFAKDAAGRTASAPAPSVQRAEVAGPWTLAFESDALHRGPAQPVSAPRLFDLSTSADPAVKFYSGKIAYRTSFQIARPGARTVLDLGDVAVTAKVKVNGQAAGGVCFAPYRLDVTPYVKAGANELEVEVCDLWINRLVGDAELQDRPTWTSLPCCGKGTPLRKSGLIGPVHVEVLSSPQR